MDRAAIIDFGGDKIAMAELRLAEGQVSEAKRLIVDEPTAHQRVAEKICQLLWKDGAISDTPNERPVSKYQEDLVTLADELNSKSISVPTRHEVSADTLVVEVQ